MGQGSRIEFSEVLGRRVRMGRWEDLTVSTYRKIGEAVQDGRWDDAAEHADYFVDEANVSFSLYRQWIRDLRAFLVKRGVATAEVQQIDAEVREKLRLPDGGPFDAVTEWDRFRALQGSLVAAIRGEQRERALALRDEMKERWRQTHDRDVDHTYGLMSVIQDRFGSKGIADMYQELLLPLFAWRYDKFDIDKHPWDEALETLMVVACESMRGHLAGPERTGDFELIEEEDRYILRFDPCGTGQRTVRGDWIEGTPARMEPPYEWGVAKEPASWNHFTPGVCLYCAHCIVILEEMPIDRFGYPVRVVDPPVYPDTDRDPAARQKCSWTMYKDPTGVPEAVYERVGRSKPSVFGSSHFDQPDLPEAGSLGLPGTG